MSNQNQGGSNQGGSNQGGSSERGGSGNFANDPQRASEAGKKGGQSHGRSQDEQTGSPGKNQQGGTGQGSTGQGGTGQGGTGQQGGSGKSNFADDPERASEAGRKGGQKSHGSNK